MKKSVKRVMCALVALGAALTCFSGCGTNENAGNAITVAVFDRGVVPASEGNYEQNRWTDYICTESGVDVKYVAIPRSDAQVKYNALFAADQAPDIVIEYDRRFLINLINQGVLQPVDKFIEKYSTEYKKYIEDNNDLRKYTIYNGSEYFITSKRANNLNHGIMIRQDWLDKLGLKMPETDEELIEIGKAFRDRDPDGNGVDDTVAFSMRNYMQIVQAMYMSNPLWYVNENDEPEFGYSTERMNDTVSFLKTLYDEKLIDPELITDKDGSNQRSLWANGKSGICFGEALGYAPELMQNNPDANPVPLPPVKTKYGQNSYWTEDDPNFYLAFNKNIKNPKAAMQFIDWLISEGWKKLSYGEEGVHCKLDNGIYKIIDKQKYDDEVSYASGYAILSQNQTSSESMIAGAAEDELSQIIVKQQANALEVYSKYTFRRDIVDPCIEDVMTVVNDYEPVVYENVVKAMMGGSEFGVDWFAKQNKADWERLNGAEAEKLMSDWYKENK